jgi:serine/threonine protein kinase
MEVCISSCPRAVSIRALIYRSLGIVLWECLSGRFPYEMESQVLKTSDDCPKIRYSIQKGLLPGPIVDYAEALGLSTLIRQCWKLDPMHRTTADAIAKELYGITAGLAVPKPETEIAIAESQVSGVLERSDDEKILQRALEAIRVARTVNKSAKKFVQSSSTISQDDFAALVGENDGNHPVVSFVLDAALWWNIAGTSWMESEDSSVSFVTLTLDGKRVAMALKHLQDAASSGYASAYLELYKAHAFLAREFQARASD